METYFKDKKLSRGFVAERIIETKYNTGHTLYIGPGVSVVLGHNHQYRPAPSPALSMAINRRNVEEKEIHTPAVFSVRYSGNDSSKVADVSDIVVGVVVADLIAV